MRTRLRVLGTALATTAVAVTVPLVTSSEAHAARFTGGDVVVYRVGTGSSALSNAAVPVFLDEYGPTGTKVQSIALPTTTSEGNTRLTATGQSRSEGLLDRSADGRFLVVTGYDAAPGATGAGGLSLTTTERQALLEPLLPDISLLEEITGQDFSIWRQHRDGSTYQERREQV